MKIPLEEARDVSIEKRKRGGFEIPWNLLSKLNATGQNGGAPVNVDPSSRGQSLAPNEIRETLVRGGGGSGWKRKQGGEEEREEDLCRFVHERGHTYPLSQPCP